MEYTTICLNCGKPFNTASRFSKYCSEPCKKEYNKRKQPSESKQLSDLAAQINAMPDFIEDLNGVEYIPEPSQPGQELDIPILNFTKHDPVPVPASASAIPDPDPDPKPKPKTKQEPTLDLTSFVQFTDGLKLFTSIIRNKAISAATRERFLNSLSEAATAHPKLSYHQADAIRGRVSNYHKNLYIDKQTDVHHL